jgi:hypothetical protein
MTIDGDKESWEEKGRRKRKTKLESEKRRGRHGEGSRLVRTRNRGISRNESQVVIYHHEILLAVNVHGGRGIG